MSLPASRLIKEPAEPRSNRRFKIDAAFGVVPGPAKGADDELRSKIRTADAQIGRLEDSLRELVMDNEWRKEHITILMTDLEAARGKCRQLELELEEVQASKGWRLILAMRRAMRRPRAMAGRTLGTFRGRPAQIVP